MKNSFLLLALVLTASVKVYNQNKVLVQENKKTGEKILVKPGFTVKFWYYSDKKSKLFSQPMERLDFNRHRNFAETEVKAISDSCIYFMRRPYLPIPLPIPLKPKLDSVSLKNIKHFRAYSGGVMGSVQQVTMNTTVGLVPSSLNGFPMMVLLPFSSNLLLSGIGAIVFPMRKINGEQSTYKIYVEDKRVDSNLLLLHNVNMLNYNAGEDEWEIDKHTRWEKVYNRVYRMMYDSLLFQNKDKTILSVHAGPFYIPDFVKGPYDNNTGVDISDKNLVLGLSYEYFITQKSRVGMEMMFHNTKPHIDALTNSISGGGGSVMSMFSFYKYEVGDLFGVGYRKKIISELKTLNADTTEEEIQNRIDWLKNKLVSRPKLYLLTGFGTVNTNLIRFSGSPDNMSLKEYSQKSIGIEAGAGIFTRLGKRLVYDMSLKYLWTPNYAPSIGGLNSYSGFKMQFNIGLITNSGFRKLTGLN